MLPLYGGQQPQVAISAVCEFAGKRIHGRVQKGEIVVHKDG